MSYMTPPVDTRVEVDEDGLGSVWMVGLPFDHDMKQTEMMKHVCPTEDMCDAVWNYCRNGYQKQAADVIFQLLCANHSAFKNRQVLTFSFNNLRKTFTADPKVVKDLGRFSCQCTPGFTRWLF